MYEFDWNTGGQLAQRYVWGGEGTDKGKIETVESLKLSLDTKCSKVETVVRPKL